MIFNSGNILLFPVTGRLNVTLNGKGAAQLDIGKFVRFMVPQGRYRVDLLHHDVFSFASSHEIELTTAEAFLEVYPTILSNGAQLVTELPKDFWKTYTPIRKE